MNKPGPTDNSENFASMFESSLAKMDKLKPGQSVDTTIVSIGKDCAFLQLSGKSEGVLDLAEVTDKEGKLTVKEGDPIRVFFLQAKNGEMLFTTRIAGEKAGSAMLENAYTGKIPVEGLVEKEIKGGYEIKLGDTRAFCPFSQMGLKRGEKPEAYIGKRLTFKIQEYKENGRNILVSNRAIEEEALQGRREELKKTIVEKAIVKGTVASIQDFGAFVDLGGVQALLPVSEISRERVTSVGDVLTVGQEIEAEIIRVDWKSDRITLSLKSRLADPWDGVAERYPINSRHQGKVSRVADFGAFVTLEAGIDGLLHISELRGSDKYGNALSSVQKGDSVSVLIKEVDAKAKRISLRQTSAFDEDTAAQSYLKDSDTGDTYNPFAALLKKK